jgi:hypothetical protein
MEEGRTSQSPQVRVVFNVTGFGRFHGVESNPTSELVKYLPAFLAERHPPLGPVRFDSFTTIETSGVGALTALHDLALSTAPTRSPVSTPIFTSPPPLALWSTDGWASRTNGWCGCTSAWQRSRRASSWRNAP